MEMAVAAEVRAQLSAEGRTKLEEGIGLVLRGWHALRMAVENEWGGPDSRLRYQQLPHQIFSWFTQSHEQIYIDDLEDVLDDFMFSLNTEIEDGSIEEVAEKLMIMHEECLEGNFSSITRLKETAPPNIAAFQNSQDDIDEDDVNLENEEVSMGNDDPESRENVDEMDMMVDELKLNAVAQGEDGWTVVGSRRNRGRRN